MSEGTAALLRYRAAARHPATASRAPHRVACQVAGPTSVSQLRSLRLHTRCICLHGLRKGAAIVGVSFVEV